MGQTEGLECCGKVWEAVRWTAGGWWLGRRLRERGQQDQTYQRGSKVNRCPNQAPSFLSRADAYTVPVAVQHNEHSPWSALLVYIAYKVHSQYNPSSSRDVSHQIIPSSQQVWFDLLKHSKPKSARCLNLQFLLESISARDGFPRTCSRSN